MRGGDTAAIAEHAGQKSVSAREDRLLRLVISFFEQRIFGPMRIERLEKQLRASARDQRKKGKLAGTRMRQQNAFEKQKALPEEGSLVVVRDIAGARFVSLRPHADPGDRATPKLSWLPLLVRSSSPLCLEGHTNPLGASR